VNFDFSDEQYAVRDVVREIFEREWSTTRLRERWDSRDPSDGRVWKALAEVGIMALTVPEDHSGLGGDETDLVLVLEEAGQAGIPDPLIDTVAVAAPLLVEHGSEEVRVEWLPRIASGQAVASVQLAGAPFAVDADVADIVIIERGEELHLVPRERVQTVQVSSEDRARRLFTVTADVSPTTLITKKAPAVQKAASRGASATASLLNGTSLRLLEMTLEHVKARHQFGRPIGSFQAVKHKLASMHVAVEAARSAAWYAAYALARSLPDANAAASVAKAAASTTAAFVGTEALQCHGGIGFTWEHDLHLWLKRAKALETAYGSAAEHHRRLGAELFRRVAGASNA
jgi:alkylation response protein AidB-like acyl-CoA dehydrogenase